MLYSAQKSILRYSKTEVEIVEAANEYIYIFDSLYIRKILFVGIVSSYQGETLSFNKILVFI